MLKKVDHIDGLPAELETLLANDVKTNAFLKDYHSHTNKVIAIGWVLQNKLIPGI